MRLRATRLSATGGHTRKRGIDIAALFAAYPGRVGCYYGTKAGPSYSDILARNREALGPELVVNGDFLAGTSGWLGVNGALSMADGSLRVTNSGAVYGRAQQVLNTSPGKTYLAEYRVAKTTAGSGWLLAGTSPGALNNALIYFAGIQRIAAVFTATAAVTYLSLQNEAVANGTNDFAKVSVREIVDWSKLVLFDDAAGTVPVFSVFQSSRGRGLLLDRSKGLIYGENTFNPALVNFSGGSSQVATGVYRVYSPDGSYSYVSGPGFSSVVGRWYVLEFTIDSIEVAGSGLQIESSENPQAIPATVGRKRLIVRALSTQFGIKRNGGATDIRVSDISIRELPGNHMQQPTAAARGAFSSRYNLLTGTDTLSTQNVTTIAASHTLAFSGTGSITLSGAATGTYTAGTHTITTTAASLTLTVSGSVTTADLRLTADAIPSIPAYQRVTSATDYDDAGFPVYWRGQTDDWAKTRINPSGATKVLVMWAGQKMSDASTGIVLESSTSLAVNDGCVQIAAPAGSSKFHFASRGTSSSISAITDSAFSAPFRASISAFASIQTAVCQMSVNGTLATSSADQGTGSYTEQDVYFGARAGTSLFANVREFAPPLILFQPTADTGLSASQVAALDKAYAKAAGVTL